MTIIKVTYEQRRALLKAVTAESRFAFMEDPDHPGDFMIWPLETIKFRAVRELNAAETV